MVCGKPERLSLQSRTSEVLYEQGRVIELLMPVRSYWELKEMVDHVAFLLSAQEPLSEVARQYRSVVQFSSAYAVREEDRLWMKGKLSK